MGKYCTDLPQNLRLAPSENPRAFYKEFSLADKEQNFAEGRCNGIQIRKSVLVFWMGSVEMS